MQMLVVWIKQVVSIALVVLTEPAEKAGQNIAPSQSTRQIMMRDVCLQGHVAHPGGACPADWAFKAFHCEGCRGVDVSAMPPYQTKGNPILRPAM